MPEEKTQRWMVALGFVLAIGFIGMVVGTAVLVRLGSL